MSALTDAIEKMRCGLKLYEVTVTKVYHLMAHDEDGARGTIEYHDERVTCGLLHSESFAVRSLPDLGAEKP